MVISELADMRAARRLVVKVGSALLVEKGEPRARWLAALVGDRYAATNRDLQERLGTDLGALGWDVGQASSG